MLKLAVRFMYFKYNGNLSFLDSSPVLMFGVRFLQRVRISIFINFYFLFLFFLVLVSALMWSVVINEDWTSGRKKGFVYGLLRTLEVPLFLSSFISVCFCFLQNFDQYVMVVKIIGVSIVVSNNLLIAYAVLNNARIKW